MCDSKQQSEQHQSDRHQLDYSMFEADSDELAACKSRSLKILGNRQMSSKDMERRLVSKGETEENAMETVAWLERIGAICDLDYANAICRHYSTKGYGLSRIKDELYKRGIDRDMWDDALALIESDEIDDAALAFLNKKLRGSTGKDDLRRAADALARRGFGYEDAGRAVQKYLENIGDTENTEEFEMMD